MDTAPNAANDNIEMAFVDAATKLIAYLKESDRAEDAAGAFVMTAYVKQMEDKLDAAMLQLAEMKGQLNQIQQEQKQGNRTLTEYLTDATDKLAEQYSSMKQDLTEIKGEMTEKASGIVEAVRRKGLQELERVSEFFGLKEKLEKFCGKVRNALQKVDKTVERIDEFGSRMRNAGREMANASRAFAGKEEKEYGEKKFSKTELAKKPFLAQRKLLGEALEAAEKALEKCESLSVRANQGILKEEKPEQMETPEQMQPIPFAQKAKSR